MKNADRKSQTSNEVSKAIPVMEENLRLGIKQVETGKVRAIKKVHEEDLIVSGPVINDEIQIERIPLNQYVDGPPPAVRYEGETMIIPVVEEEVIVQTRLKIVEEVRITRKKVQTTVEKPITLRKEEVVVKRSAE
jgi:uncharacterized protein (TIGR02271 family)